ncbi:MAG: glycosyl hydrolase [Gammaproteobacteria bacterium]|nr:glycosyl hydrolase [Gammaproteobacteria bacterium]MCG3144705.1 Glucoamylase [Gammaproteobacteria bacterium]
MSGEGAGRAPGSPGIAPTWTSSAKDLVGSSLGPARLWFTIGFGIVNEVYYPRIDTPQIRDLGFIVADGAGFWCEVKRLGRYELQTPAPGIPAVRIVHRHPRFTLVLRIVGDPLRDALLLEVDLQGDAALRPYALLAPHLGGTGHGNIAEVACHGGRRVLRAGQSDGGRYWLALAAVDAAQRDAWGRAGAGYVGASDGWQDFDRNGAMHWQYGCAGPGNVALTGELPRRCVLALAFGASPEAATTLAIGALAQPFEMPWKRQVADWTRWHAALAPALPDRLDAPLRAQLAVSAMVLHAHQDKIHPGAMVASLSVPWGNSRDERGGYHLVWPRDLVECAGALLVLGQEAEARDVLRYLIASQHADGHWNQNQWLGGKAYWQGVQLDEAAFPVLLAALLAERGALGGIEAGDMVRRALGFIARNGPASDQDRWEEDAGVNPFTLAVCIAALVAGADFLDPQARELALALADDWNARIEEFTAVSGTALARRLGVAGYYVRVAPATVFADEQALHRCVPIKNRRQGAMLPADEQVATDALQLVRFALRSPDDPLVRDTVAVIDALLKVDTPSGPAWRRYNGDGYGEHQDGAPFDGSGRGRPWPLLTGERGHYELAAGRDPMPYLRAMAAMASGGGMLPEQVWDAAPIPARGLVPGRPTGSAMPLAWAHAEFVKLALSCAGAHPCDCPAAVWERYRGRRPMPHLAVWLERAPRTRVVGGVDMLVCLGAPALVHWGVDGWQEPADVGTRPMSLDLHVARLPTAALRTGQCIDFTWRWQATGEWVGTDRRVVLEPPVAAAMAATAMPEVP